MPTPIDFGHVRHTASPRKILCTSQTEFSVAESLGKLMQRLIELCAQARIREMVAVIADPSLSTASITLHRSMGFEEVGVLRGVGQKFGKTIDVLIMQKSLR